jgi:hypothetical protein
VTKNGAPIGSQDGRGGRVVVLPDYLLNAETGSRCSYSSRDVRIGLAPGVRSHNGTSEGWTLSFIRAVGEEEKLGLETSYT